MQANIEDITSVRKKVHFEIPAADVNKALNNAYREVNKTASIKGFRKGKIPRTVLESRFGKDINADVSNKFIRDAFAETIEKDNIQAIGTPLFTPENPMVEKDNDFIVDFEVDIRPEIENIDFHGLELKKNMYQVTDAEIDAQLEMVRRSFGTRERVSEERPVKSSDFVMIDYQGFVDGEPLDAAPKVENHVMAIGAKDMPEEFSGKLVGAVPPQELEFDVVYPDNDPNQELAGKTVTYKLSLKEVQELVLPRLDDDLAKKMGDFNTLDEVRAVIANNLQDGIDMRIHHELSEQIFLRLLEKYPFEVPETLIDLELDSIVRDTDQRFAQSNITPEMRSKIGYSDEDIRKNSREIAQKQAKRHALLRKIIEQEKIELTDEETDSLLRRSALMMGISLDDLGKILQESPEKLETIKYYELEKEAINLIMEKSSVIEVEPEVVSENIQPPETDKM
ncbi:MAG: trigger factor [Desulfamplus sp.]|nr:trigger factor [Desulfamplus sp.]